MENNDNLVNNIQNLLANEILEVVAESSNIDNIIAEPMNAGFDEVMEEIQNAVLMVANENNALEIRPRTSPETHIINYYEETIPQYTDEQFYQNFRMPREVFERLVDVVTPKVLYSEYEIPLRKKILLTIWILATPDSFRSVADRFGLSKSIAHSVFKEIVKILSDLMPTYITWPNQNEQEIITNSFMEHFNYPGVIGAVDGCHIEIIQPPHNAHDFYNRKNTHSIVLQGTCDHNGKFIDVLIGRPGRAHDANIFRSSPLYNRIMDDNNPLLREDAHILGDAAYPLSMNVLVPFRDNGYLTPRQIYFNEKHASARSVIERAFGLLKAKFRRLYYLDVKSVRMANLIISASCMLHNFLLIHGVNARNTRNLNNLNVPNNENEMEHQVGLEEEAAHNAIQKRIRIMNCLN